MEKKETKQDKNTNKRSSRKYFEKRKDSFQEIAKTRIEHLFQEAEKIFEEDSSLADRYVYLARQISLKFKVPFTKEQKLKSCKKCNSFLVHGRNARVRLSKGNRVLSCGKCKYIRRVRYCK